MNKLDLLKTCLRNAIFNIDTGNSNLTDEQCEDLINTINKISNTQNKYSKYQSYNYLGLSRATFDRYIKDEIIPEGRKESGFKEKFWYKEDLDKAKERILSFQKK